MVLAAGGNESTRLLLAEQARAPARFGGVGGPLGRFYMGHVNGQIADIAFESQALHDGMNFHVDANGSYVRRRLVPSDALQEAAGLANVAFWPVVPAIADPAHRSGPLSAIFLGLSIGPLARKLIAEPIRLKHVGPPPYKRGAHLRNLMLDAPRVLGFMPWFLWHNRVARMRLPGFSWKIRPAATRSNITASSCPRPRAGWRSAPAPTGPACRGSPSICVSRRRMPPRSCARTRRWRAG